jgi:hypothetical protein
MKPLLTALAFVLLCSAAGAQGLGGLNGDFGAVGSPPGYREVPTIGGFQNHTYVPVQPPPPAPPMTSYVPYSTHPVYEGNGLSPRTLRLLRNY